MSGRYVTVYYDQLQDGLISSTNTSAATLTSTYPELFRNNEHFIVRANVYSDASASTMADCSALTLTAKIGTAGSAALISVASAAFNSASDWGAVSPANGKICFYCNTCGSAIDTALGSLGQKQYVCHINGNDGDSDDRTVAQFPIILVNTPE